MLRSTDSRADTHSENSSRVIRAQDGAANVIQRGAYEPAPAETRDSSIEPAIWRGERIENQPLTPQIQMTRYSPSGTAAGRIVPVSQAMHSQAATTSNMMQDVDYRARVGSALMGQTVAPTTAPLETKAPFPQTFPHPMPTAPGPETSMGPALKSQTAPQIFLPLTLREAIESALSDSAVVRTLEGRVNVSRITPADVEIADWNVDAERGQFQPRLRANIDATKVDQPPNAFFGPGISANTQRDVVDARLRLEQPLTTGGQVSVGIEPSTAYLYFPEGVGVGEFNPLYSTDYVIRVNQPILRGGGSQTAKAPIRIAQIQASASRHDLEEVLNSQIRSLTESYWRLYAAYLQLQAVRAVIPLAEESVRIENLRLKADRSIHADVARAQVQLDGFRRTETTMQGELRKRVLQLRQLMGGQPMVEPLLLPSEPPMETPPPNGTASLIETAIQTRPSLCALRDRLNEKQQVLGVANNSVLPSVDLRGEYRMNGLDERLDDAFNQAASRQYSDTTLGVAVNVPIGNKTARSRRRMAELEVARDRMRLDAMEQNVSFEVVELVSDLEASWQRMQIAKRQTKETQEWLRVSRIRYTQPPAASSSQDWLLLALTDLQSAMRSSVDAITDLSEAAADYNTLLAELQQAQGVSVYEWRQSHSGQTVLGGHTGLMSTDYRSSPVLNGAGVQMFHSSTPGHAFGQVPQPQP